MIERDGRFHIRFCESPITTTIVRFCFPRADDRRERLALEPPPQPQQGGLKIDERCSVRRAIEARDARDKSDV